MDKGQGRSWENIKEVMAVIGDGRVGWSGGSGRDKKRSGPGYILQVQPT